MWIEWRYGIRITRGWRSTCVTRHSLFLHHSLLGMTTCGELVRDHTSTCIISPLQPHILHPFSGSTPKRTSNGTWHKQAFLVSEKAFIHARQQPFFKGSSSFPLKSLIDRLSDRSGLSCLSGRSGLSDRSGLSGLSYRYLSDLSSLSLSGRRSSYLELEKFNNTHT